MKANRSVLAASLIKLSLITLLVASAVWLLSISPPVIAQEPGRSASLQITDVDTSQFPTVSLFVAGTNLEDSLASLPIALYENSIEQVTTESYPVERSMQLAFILNVSNTIENPGLTGSSRYIEAGLAARRLVSLGVLSAEADWLTAISIDDNEQPQHLNFWSRDHQAVADSLYTYQLPPNKKGKYLVPLLTFAINSFNQIKTNDLANARKAIVIFTDSAGISNDLKLQELIEQATKKSIKIHIVMLGPQTIEIQKISQRFVTLANGQYYHLTISTMVDSLWNSIKTAREQLVFSYRSHNPNIREIWAQTITKQGQILQDRILISPIDLQPPKVSIRQPQNSFIFIKPPFLNDVQVNLSEQLLNIRIEIQWPDNYLRNISLAEYVVGNTVYTQKRDSLDHLQLKIADLPAGNYTLQVRVTDELGLTGESTPITFEVQYGIPVTPTVVPDPTLVAEATNAVLLAAKSTEEAIAVFTREAEQAKALQASEARVVEVQTRVQQVTWATIGAVALAVIAFAYAIYILSSRDRRRPATQVITGTVAAVTEPFRRSPSDAISETGVKLVLVSDGGTAGMPPTIPIQRGGVRIGRDPSVVNVPLADRRVSKLHCRIVEDGATSAFRILDEGSTSGTYVNDQEIGINGQLLQNHDLISIGPLLYRFEVTDETNGDDDDKRQRPNLDPDTEPYIRPPASNEVKEFWIEKPVDTQGGTEVFK